MDNIIHSLRRLQKSASAADFVRYTEILEAVRILKGCGEVPQAYTEYIRRVIDVADESERERRETLNATGAF